jgi:hypothetical protein
MFLNQPPSPALSPRTAGEPNPTIPPVPSAIDVHARATRLLSSRIYRLSQSHSGWPLSLLFHCHRTAYFFIPAFCVSCFEKRSRWKLMVLALRAGAGGLSMHARSVCSTLAQPEVARPPEAQHAVLGEC